MKTIRIDPWLGISKAAREVFSLVRKARKYPELVQISSFAFYNGRERVIGLDVVYGWGPHYMIVFGECRNSDQIFVDEWEEGLPDLNPPTPDSFPTDAYQGRSFFRYSEAKAAAKYVLSLIDAWVKDREASEKIEKRRIP